MAVIDEITHRMRETPTKRTEAHTYTYTHEQGNVVQKTARYKIGIREEERINRSTVDIDTLNKPGKRGRERERYRLGSPKVLKYERSDKRSKWNK